MSLKQLAFWFVFIVVLAGSWQLLSLPDEAAIKAWLLQELAIHGLYFVMIGALLESLLFVGLYFPGSLLIFLSVASAESVEVAVVRVLAVSGGVLIGYLFDYCLGRYGWYRLFTRFGLTTQIQAAKTHMSQRDLMYVLATYWNPALASITATAAGVMALSLRRFLLISIIGVAVWNTFWGVLVFTLGAQALSLISTKTILIVLGVMIVVKLVTSYGRRVFGGE